MTNIEDVYEFHRYARTPREGGVNTELVQQTIRHLREEMTELLAARLGATDLDLPFAERCKYHRETCDAFVDIAYVAFQGLVAMGLHMKQAEDLWDTVHAANMQKFPGCQPCKGTGWNPETDEACPNCRGFGATVIRNSAGKILKPEGWTPPNLEALLPDSVFKTVD